MRDMKELCRIIEEELGKIAEKGLNTSNLETAYKLIDMYKDIKNTEYWDTKCEYYETVLDEMRGGGSSYAMEHDYSGRHRDSRGRYSHNDKYDHGNSYARRGEHYVRGHYSRADGEDDYDRYMEHKHSYRNGDKSSDCKKRMIGSLDDHLSKLAEELAELSRDADCVEERQVLQNFSDKLRSSLR